MTRIEERNPVTPAEMFASRLQAAQSADERELKNETAARELGVSLRLYQMWRAGQMPSMHNLVRVAKFYGRPVGWFLGDEDVTS